MGSFAAMVNVDTGAEGHVSALLGGPGLAFTRGPLSVDPDGLAAARSVVALRLEDVNGDGVLDVVTANLQNRRREQPWDFVAVQRGLGDGRFEHVASWPLEGLAETLWASLEADASGDGRPDLLACTASVCGVSAVGADGAASPFRPLPNEVGGEGPPTSVVALELDGDGAVDLAAGSADDRSLLLWRGAGADYEVPEVLFSWGRGVAVIAHRGLNELWFTTWRGRDCYAPCDATAECAEGVCTLGYCDECYLNADCPGEGGVCQAGRCHYCGSSADCPADFTCRQERCVRTVSSEDGWQDVSLGYNTTCGLRENGEVRCWGSATPAPSGRFVKVEVSPVAGTAACAMGEDHHLACWGPGWMTGEPPLTEALDIALLDSFACALDLEGEARCWRTRTTDLPDAVITVSPTPGPFTQLAASEGTVCGLRGDGEVSCWSCDDASGSRCSGVVEGAPPDGPFVALSVGSGRACALRPDRTVACWGNRALTPSPSHRYLDLDVRTNRAVFVTEAGELEVYGDEATWSEDLLRSESPYVRASTGASAMCGVRADGRIKCVGAGQDVP